MTFGIHVANDVYWKKPVDKVRYIEELELGSRWKCRTKELTTTKGSTMMIITNAVQKSEVRLLG